MYTLHLQHPAVTLHPRGLHGRLAPPNLATPPRLPHRSTPSPLPAAAAGSRSAYAPLPPRRRRRKPTPNHPDESRPKGGFWAKWMVESAEMRTRAAKLGLAAVRAYGLFDAVTYTVFSVLAFLGYEKSTGKNPAANLKALLGLWTLLRLSFSYTDSSCAHWLVSFS